MIRTIATSLVPILVVMALRYFAVYGLVLLLKMPELSARAATLLTALPSGIFGILFGLQCGRVPSIVGSTLIVSTLLSVVTLTAAIIVTGTH